MRPRAVRKILATKHQGVLTTKGTEKQATKKCNLFCNMLQNGLKSDVARFATHVQTCQQPDLLKDRFELGSKMRNVALHLVLRQCCKTSFMSFVARFSVP